MSDFQVARAHLKSACDARNWDLLDKLLAIDSSGINDHSLYTDTWGVWWGLLLEAIRLGEADGVRVLLKYGAKRDLASWGDGIEVTPLEAAKDKPEIIALLTDPRTPTYSRMSDPPLPQGESPEDAAINRQGEIRDGTGLVFPAPILNPKDKS